MQVEPPQRVAEYLAKNAFALLRIAIDCTARAGRRENVQAIGGADLVNPEKMCPIADDDQPAQPIRTGDHGNAVSRFLGVAALGLSDDGDCGNAGTHQVLAAYGALAVLVATVAPERDDQRGNSVVEQGVRVVEAGAVDREGLPSYSAAPRTPMASAGAA